MITGDQLLCHLVGDFLFQPHTLALRKTSDSVACAFHVLLYILPFWFLIPSPAAFVVIAVSHFLIDRFRVARVVSWLHNAWLTPRSLADSPNGYPPDTPLYLSTWLLIITDQLLHLLCNGLALKFL